MFTVIWVARIRNILQQSTVWRGSKLVKEQGPLQTHSIVLFLRSVAFTQLTRSVHNVLVRHTRFSFPDTVIQWCSIIMFVLVHVYHHIMQSIRN